MKPEVSEWSDKAEGNLVSAEREYRARKLPNYDSACFHAQQRFEKYMQARLVEVGIYFSRIYDLGQLLNLVAPVEPMWEPFRAVLNRVSNFAVDYRYPGEFTTKEDAREALKTRFEFRHAARNAMGLPK